MGKKEKANSALLHLKTKIDELSADDEIISEFSMPAYLFARSKGSKLSSLLGEGLAEYITYYFKLGKHRLYGYTIYTNTYKIGIIVPFIPVYKKYHVVGFALPHRFFTRIEEKGTVNKVIHLQYLVLDNNNFESSIQELAEIKILSPKKSFDSSLYKIKELRENSDVTSGFFYHFKF